MIKLNRTVSLKEKCFLPLVYTYGFKYDEPLSMFVLLIWDFIVKTCDDNYTGDVDKYISKPAVYISSNYSSGFTELSYLGVTLIREYSRSWYIAHTGPFYNLQKGVMRVHV